MNSQKNRFIREIALKLQGIRQHFGYSRQEMAWAVRRAVRR